MTLPKTSGESSTAAVGKQAVPYDLRSTMLVRFHSTFPQYTFVNSSVPGGYSSKNTPYTPASGGADGSLLLSDEEIARDDHNPMQGFRAYLLAKWELYKGEEVSAADFVQAAGNIGVRSCLGPVVKTVSERICSRSTKLKENEC